MGPTCVVPLHSYSYLRRPLRECGVVAFGLPPTTASDVVYQTAPTLRRVAEASRKQPGASGERLSVSGRRRHPSLLRIVNCGNQG